jgi:putative ATPase
MSSDGECPICFCNFPKSVIGVHASSCTGKKPNSSSFEKALKRPAPTSNHPFFATPAKQPKQQEEELEKTEQKKKPPALVHNTKVPLAEAMRPTSLSEFVGQEELCSQNGMWQALLQGSPARLPCLILWGPPGTGKTSLANVVAIKCKANSGEARFVKLSACTSGVADVKEVVKVAKNEWKMFKKRTVLFVDEIHRFNKTQQDAFLPHMEDGMF